MRRSSWRYAPLAVLVGVIAGAATGAVTHTAHFSYRAQAVIDARVAGGQGSPAAQIVMTMAAAARTSAVLSAARIMSGVDSIGTKARLTPQPAAGLLVVQASGSTAADAIVAANAIADATSQFLRAERLRVRGAVTVGDFESDLDGWELAPRLFPAAAAAVVAQSTSTSRVGAASLEVKCEDVSGCGTWVRVFYPFRKGMEYTVAGDVKSGSKTGLALDVGVPGDRTHSDVVTAPGRWSGLTAKWVPSRNEPFAEIAFTTTRASRVDFYVDWVTLSETRVTGLLPSTPERAGKPFVFYAGNATATHPRTAVAVGVGALLGLLATLGGLVCGRFALRAEETRRQADEQPHA